MGAPKSRDGLARSLPEIPEEQKARFAKLFHALLAQGVYLAPSGFEVSFLSTVHTDEQLDRVIAAIEGARYE